jgi:UDP-glucose 4-epimerase
MKILITGAAGFIASHVSDAYLALGHEVVIVDNLYSGYLHNVNPRAKFYRIDVCSPELEEVFVTEKPDIVNHHAAQISVPLSVKDPRLDAEVNVKGFINVLENCVKYKVKKVIFISSGGAIYGEAEEYPSTEKCPTKPLSPYAINKMVSESYLYFYKHQYGLNYTVLRYANVFGPRQVSHGEAGVVSIFIEKFLAGVQPNFYSFADEPDGMIRDYVYVKDVVKANVIALDKGEGEAFNIGTGIETTTGILYREIASQMKCDIKPILGQARAGDLHRSLLNADKAKRVLGWSADYTLAQGIAETIEFFYNK